MLVHVIQPDKKGYEANNDQQFIPPWRYCIHDFEDKLKKIANCIPETSPHSCCFFVGAKIEKSSDGKTIFKGFPHILKMQ